MSMAYFLKVPVLSSRGKCRRLTDIREVTEDFTNSVGWILANWMKHVFDFIIKNKYYKL